VSCRKLVLVLGDQLDRESSALLGADPDRDRVLMIEARNESRRIWSHKARTGLFFAAMRHHAAWLRDRGWRVDYVDVSRPEAESFGSALRHAISKRSPQVLSMVEAGEHGVQDEIDETCADAGVEVERLPDSHFLCSREAFTDWRTGRRKLVMEHFYRHMRQRLDILMDDGEPAGGEWNFDRHNRERFGRDGPGMLPAPAGFEPDRVTRAALRDVERHFGDNPGRLDDFSWPVTREQALAALEDFVEHRLAAFGPYQDAMWQDQPWLYHSMLSAALNMKLLCPREVVDAAVDAWRANKAPLASVEGFVRQIVGWREYVRGIYLTEMPGYTTRNALKASEPLPDFYWTGETDMACLRETLSQTLAYGYAHHIQRLMVTGLYALLLGVRPEEVHRWYLAVYVDAIEWVEAPNTIGMSQHADGGLLGSKPYAASGRYIQRMSNYCDGCRYRPDRSSGDDACPFTTLYWDFLIRHEDRFAKHPRAAMQWRNLKRFDDDARDGITKKAAAIRRSYRR
jgi:deoxyribodipyrimidine photolyase-related protein